MYNSLTDSNTLEIYDMFSLFLSFLVWVPVYFGANIQAKTYVFYEEIHRYCHVIVYMVFFFKHYFIKKIATSYVTILY